MTQGPESAEPGGPRGRCPRQGPDSRSGVWRGEGLGSPVTKMPTSNATRWQLGLFRLQMRPGV